MIFQYQSASGQFTGQIGGVLQPVPSSAQAYARYPHGGYLGNISNAGPFTLALVSVYNNPAEGVIGLAVNPSGLGAGLVNVVSAVDGTFSFTPYNTPYGLLLLTRVSGWPNSSFFSSYGDTITDSTGNTYSVVGINQLTYTNLTTLLVAPQQPVTTQMLGV